MRIIGPNEAPFLAIKSPLPPPSVGIQPAAQHRWLGYCPYTQREKLWDHPRGAGGTGAFVTSSAFARTWRCDPEDLEGSYPKCFQLGVNPSYGGTLVAQDWLLDVVDHSPPARIPRAMAPPASGKSWKRNTSSPWVNQTWAGSWSHSQRYPWDQEEWGVPPPNPALTTYPAQDGEGHWGQVWFQGREWGKICSLSWTVQFPFFGGFGGKLPPSYPSSLTDLTLHAAPEGRDGRGSGCPHPSQTAPQDRSTAEDGSETPWGPNGNWGGSWEQGLAVPPWEGPVAPCGTHQRSALPHSGTGRR